MGDGLRCGGRWLLVGSRAFVEQPVAAAPEPEDTRRRAAPRRRGRPRSRQPVAVPARGVAIRSESTSARFRGAAVRRLLARRGGPRPGARHARVPRPGTTPGGRSRASPSRGPSPRSSRQPVVIRSCLVLDVDRVAARSRRAGGRRGAGSRDDLDADDLARSGTTGRTCASASCSRGLSLEGAGSTSARCSASRSRRRAGAAAVVGRTSAGFSTTRRPAFWSRVTTVPSDRPSADRAITFASVGPVGAALTAMASDDRTRSSSFAALGAPAERSAGRRAGAGRGPHCSVGSRNELCGENGRPSVAGDEELPVPIRGDGGAIAEVAAAGLHRVDLLLGVEAGVDERLPGLVGRRLVVGGRPGVGARLVAGVREA